MNELISVLEKTIKHLNHSEESDWSSLTQNEVKELLESEIAKIRDGLEFDKLNLRVLYTVTSNIQEISMANNWHDEYLEISNIIDKFTE